MKMIENEKNNLNGLGCEQCITWTENWKKGKKPQRIFKWENYFWKKCVLVHYISLY